MDLVDSDAKFAEKDEWPKVFPLSINHLQHNHLTFEKPWLLKRLKKLFLFYFSSYRCVS